MLGLPLAAQTKLWPAGCWQVLLVHLMLLLTLLALLAQLPWSYQLQYNSERVLVHLCPQEMLATTM